MYYNCLQDQLHLNMSLLKLNLVIGAREESFEFDPKDHPVVTVGRGGDGVLVEVQSSNVSARHLDLVYMESKGGWNAVDLGSTNGSILASSTLSPGMPVNLPLSGTLYLGQYVQLRFELDEDDEKGTLLDRLLESNGQAVIGRGAEADIQLDDPRVSREHALVTKRNGLVYVQDRKSSNGTFLDSREIKGEEVWDPKSTLFVGSHAFKLSLSGQTRVSLPQEIALTARGVSVIYNEGRPNAMKALQTLDLEFGRGKMIGLMGPSGCGKSTLLKMLMGEVKSSTGTVAHNGLELNENFQMLSRQVGYVPQDEVLHADLTLDETMRFAGQLRNPPGTGKDAIRRKSDEVLRSLDIASPDLRSKKIKELSGGQRKRAAIAVELLRDPQFLFLDEPTSPLDPESIKEFLKTVKKLSEEKQITVVLVTHKPEDRKYLDQVVFLGRSGYMCYLGDPMRLEQHFGVEEIEDVYRKLSLESECVSWNQRLPKASEVAADGGDMKREYPRILGRWRQFGVFVARYFKIKTSQRSALTFSFLQPLAIGLLMLLVYTSFLEETVVELTGQKVTRGEIGALFLLSISVIWFGISSSAKEIVGEKAIFRREYYLFGSVVPYLFSKYMVLGGLVVCQTLCLLLVVAWQVEGLGHFWGTLGILSATGMVAIAFGTLLSSWAKNIESVMSNLPIALIPQVLFAGVVAGISEQPSAVAVSFGTMSRWCMELLSDCQDRAVEAGAPFGDVMEANLYGSDMPLEIEWMWGGLLALWTIFCTVSYFGILNQLKKP